MQTNAAAVISVAPEIRLKRILFATDFSTASELALPVVSAIARRYKSKVYLAHVWSPLSATLSAPTLSDPTRSDNDERVTIMMRMDSSVRASLERIAAGRDLAGVETHLCVASGDVANELFALVRDMRADLVVIGTHGRTGLSHLIMGSTAETLWRQLPCPVLTIGPNCVVPADSKLETIVVPTDLSPASLEVLDAVAPLAADVKAEVVGVHVIPATGRSAAESSSMAEAMAKEGKRIFADAISPSCRVRFELDFGEPAERTVHLAKESKADLIAMSVHEAARLGTHFRNTVAYRVALTAPCPVLTSRAH